MEAAGWFGRRVMSVIVSRLDRALRALEGQGLSPVTILLGEADYEVLAGLGEWPVTRTSRGELRYRSTAVFKARPGEAGALVGRGVNGATRRIPLDQPDLAPEAQPK
jgi:hypothetical protein